MFFRRYWFLLVPVTVFLAISFLWPLASMLVGTVYSLGKGLSLDLYAKFAGDAFYRSILWRTVKLGLIVTLVCILAATPFRFICRGLEADARRFFLHW